MRPLYRRFGLIVCTAAPDGRRGAPLLVIVPSSSWRRTSARWRRGRYPWDEVWMALAREGLLDLARERMPFLSRWAEAPAADRRAAAGLPLYHGVDVGDRLEVRYVGRIGGVV